MKQRLTIVAACAVFLALFVSACQEKAPVGPEGNNPGVLEHPLVEFSTLYATQPNVAQCTAGTLVQSERTKVLNYVNALRARHGLASVTYRAEDDRSTAEASLIMVANNALEHYPPATYTCWTQAGRDGAEHSNIYSGSRIGSSELVGTKVAASEDMIDEWLKDSTVGNAGHRRWLLSPWLKYISFGRCDRIKEDAEITTINSAGAIRVVYDEVATPNAAIRYVAYPVGEYPARLWNKDLDMSFSAIANTNDIWANLSVNFAQATISITDDNGGNVAVSNIRTMNDGAGVPNILLWRASLDKNRAYTVRINGVQMPTGAKNFEYTINISTRA